MNIHTATRNVPLGDVADVIRGVTFSKSEATDEPLDGHVPVLRAGNIAEGLRLDDDLVFVDAARVSKVQRLHPGDIVMCTSSGSANVLGKSALLDRPWSGSFGAFLAVIRPHGNHIEPRFLAHFFRTPEFRSWASASEGIGIKNIRGSALKEISIPLPPIEEQKRIAAILDQADALRRLRRRALDRLNALGQSIFHEMFGGPQTHPRRAIVEFAHVKGGKRLPKGSSYSAIPTQHPYIRVSDISNLTIQTQNLKYIEHDIHNFIKRYIVQDGDVVISIAGTIGLVAAVPPELSGANLTENAAKITPRSSETFDAQYLAWALSSLDAQRQIAARTGQVTIGKLALFRIEQVEVPFPDLNIQEGFSARISRLNAQKASLMRAIDFSEVLFGSLQASAFQGKI